MRALFHMQAAVRSHSRGQPSKKPVSRGKTGGSTAPGLSGAPCFSLITAWKTSCQLPSFARAATEFKPRRSPRGTASRLHSPERALDLRSRPPRCHPLVPARPRAMPARSGHLRAPQRFAPTWESEAWMPASAQTLLPSPSLSRPCGGLERLRESPWGKGQGR